MITIKNKPKHYKIKKCTKNNNKINKAAYGNLYGNMIY